VWVAQFRKIVAAVRDAALLGGGLYFAYNEIVVVDHADEKVLILVAGMLGLGAIFRA
jgi:hypothetical protein